MGFVACAFFGCSCFLLIFKLSQLQIFHACLGSGSSCCFCAAAAILFPDPGNCLSVSREYGKSSAWNQCNFVAFSSSCCTWGAVVDYSRLVASDRAAFADNAPGVCLPCRMFVCSSGVKQRHRLAESFAVPS